MRKRLLRLYPRAWRARYGEEFLAAFDGEPLGVQDVIDIVSGAIDAWLSADVRQTTMASRVAPTGGGSMTLKGVFACERKASGVTPRDGVIGAGVMLGMTLLFKVLSTMAARNGLPVASDFFVSLSIPASFTLSMPFWLMKGQPWKAQLAIVGGTFLILVGITLFSSAS
jgi:hypothetical protein